MPVGWACRQRVGDLHAGYTIAQADLDSGSVTNSAMASANGTVSNEDHRTVTAVPGPKLDLVKTATPTTYSAVGDVIGYSYALTNTGNVTLSGPFHRHGQQGHGELSGYRDPRSR